MRSRSFPKASSKWKWPVKGVFSRKCFLWIILNGTLLTGAKSFYETTNRLTCLVQLSQVIKVTLRNHDDVSEIAHDWKGLDFSDVARDIAMLCGNEDSVFSFVRKCKYHPLGKRNLAPYPFRGRLRIVCQFCYKLSPLCPRSGNYKGPWFDSMTSWRVRSRVSGMSDFERLLAQHASLQKYIAFAENIFRYCSSVVSRAAHSLAVSRHAIKFHFVWNCDVVAFDFAL